MCSSCHGGLNHGWCAICEEQVQETAAQNHTNRSTNDA